MVRFQYDGSTMELKRNWTRRDPTAIAKVTRLLDLAGLTEDAVLAQTLAVKLDQIDRIDRMTFQAERRRDLAIQQIERRREDVAARARAAVKRDDDREIEDAEFKELSEPEAPKKVAESEALRMEEELRTPAAAEEPKAYRTEYSESTCPRRRVTMGAKKQRSPRLPLLRRIRERPQSAEREHALEQRVGRGAQHRRGLRGALAVAGEQPCD